MSKDEAIKILLDLNYLKLFNSNDHLTADQYDNHILKIRDIFRKENVWLFIKDSGDIAFRLYSKQSNGMVEVPLFLVKITDLILLNRKNKLNKVN